MALTRAYLRGLSLTDEQVNAIIEAHAETVDGLKAVNADLQSKLDAAQPDAAKAAEFEQKYTEAEKALADYRAEVEAADARRNKAAAYRDMLRAAGVSEKRFDAIMRVDSAVIDALEFDEHGGVKDADAVNKSISESWGDFITESATVPGNPTPTPPAPAPAAYSMADVRGMSAAEINANWSAVKAAMSGENQS